ncbi:MAG TPA: COQ9 family protein [Paracoccaceae bacterium]|nr:COQ9 family protein [Paracoccaceae bacterium]
MTATSGLAPETLDEARAKLLAAALPHVPFDGWSQATLRAAAADTGIDPAIARAAFPRGGVDLALEFHRVGDRDLAEELAAGGLTHLRYSERIAHAIRRRLEMAAPHKEAVRRAASLFALPLYAADGARALWQTADTIWKGLGDSSTDYNWYTKRLTLSGVLSATILYWLGDDSEGSVRTWDFLDRRIADVMRVEKAKATLRENPLARIALAGPRALLSLIRAPGSRTWEGPGPGLPGTEFPDKMGPGLSPQPPNSA